MTSFIQFQHPFTAIIAGPTGCGKTDFVIELVEKQNDIIVPAPTKIYYCYTIWQEKFNLLIKKSKFLEEAYQDATKDPHGYLFIDLKQTTLNDFRIQTNIFSNKEKGKQINLVFMAKTFEKISI